MSSSTPTSVLRTRAVIFVYVHALIRVAFEFGSTFLRWEEKMNPLRYENDLGFPKLS
jgi:hypothetical protein